MDWLGEAPASQQDIGRYLRRYHEDLGPGYLLALLKAAAGNGSLKVPSLAGFLATSYRGNSVARSAAVAMFPSLDQQTQSALLLVLRLGGQDISALLPAVAKETIASFQTLAPLSDPRQNLHFPDPVTPQSTQDLAAAMDQCWSGWMATGDQSYLRALVGLLAWAPDFPAFQSWLKAKGGAKGFNPAVARGIIYQIAGWSIGSFRRTDPHVTDWLLYWENDPGISPALRKELMALPTNPAFIRK